MLSKACQTTTHKDQCGNIGILWNCSGFNIDRLPYKIPNQLHGRNVTLDLSFNRFSTINESTFENLTAVSVVTSMILNHNDITNIENKTFHALTGLCSLDISYCHLNNNCIEADAFSRLPIKYLNIDHNNFKNEHVYPDVALSALQSLRSLEIDIFDNFEFTTTFESLTNLSQIKFNIQSVFSLSNTSFLGLKSSKIRQLNLTFANYVLCDVTEDLFCSFPFLTDVFINFGGKCDVTPALRSLKCLQHRNINNITLYENKKKIETRVIILNDFLLEYVVNICVRKLFLIENSIASITKNIQNTRLWNCLEELDLSKNDLHVVDVSVIATWFSAPKLKYLNYCCNDPYCPKNSIADVVQYTYRSGEYITLTLPEKLEILDISKNRLHNVEEKNRYRIVGESLRALNIRETNFPLGNVYQFDFPSLKALDLSGNKFVDVHADLFQSSLGIQNLSFSNVDFKFSTPNSENIFKNMKNLSILELSENNLNFLPLTFFIDQTKSLTEINLDYNRFFNIPDSLRYLQNLKNLSIRNNLISEFSENDQRMFENLNNVSLYLKANPMSCICSSLESLLWMKNNKHLFADLDRISCVGSRNLITHLLNNDQIWRKFQLECQTEAWLIVSVVLIVLTLTILLISFTVWKYRVHVEYVILRFKNRCKDVSLGNRKNNYIYDVFVSYGEEDYAWIIRYLYPKLERLNIKAWLKDKDSIPGNWEAEEIVKCINESRKVLFVITECFLESGWASYAVQMAVTHAFHNQRQSSIVVIIKDDIPLERLPNDIKNIWWCIEYLRWSTVDENDDSIMYKLSSLLKPFAA
ncbi:toll-like receptor 6 [Saccostrea cucullata]|uniref:toll-like receptor 6 n=1 Tax=Saccostrea cuccullata TaxID=36930 RepID=UPI002ED49A60